MFVFPLMKNTVLNIISCSWYDIRQILHIFLLLLVLNYHSDYKWYSRTCYMIWAHKQHSVFRVIVMNKVFTLFKNFHATKISTIQMRLIRFMLFRTQCLSLYLGHAPRGTPEELSDSKRELEQKQIYTEVNTCTQ